MQIFSPIQVKGTEVKRIEEQGRVLSALGTRIAEMSHELNVVTGQVVDTTLELNRRKEEMASVELDHSITVARLEARKAEALEPVDELKEEWRKQVIKAAEETGKMKHMTEVLENEKNKVIELTTDLEYRIQELEKRSEALDAREKGIALESSRLTDETNRLSSALQTATVRAHKREDALAQRERTIVAHEESLKVLEKTYREDRGAWEIEKAQEKGQLADERKSLARQLSMIKK